MVNIQNAENNRVYILKAEDNPGKAEVDPINSEYYDFTGYLTYFKVKKKINNVSTVELNLAGIDTSTLRDYVKAGNYLYVITGYNDGLVHNKLVGKFLLEKPVYDNKNTVKVKGIQSMANNSNNKHLTRTDSAFKIKQQHETLNNVLFGSSGICVDTESNNLLTNSIATSVQDYTLSIDVDYNNRLDLLKKVCEQAEVEWDVIYGVNDATPYSEGDALFIDDNLGTIGSSQHTFYLSGVNTNCFASKGVKTVSKMCNNVIVKGSDFSGNPIETNMFDGGQAETTIDLSGFVDTYISFDAWLYDDVYNDSYSGGVEDTLNEGQTRTYEINGGNYETTVLDINDTYFLPTVRITINGETSSSLKEGGSYTYSDGSNITISDIDTSASPMTVTFQLGGSPTTEIKLNKNSFIAYHDGGEVYIKIDNEIMKGTVDDSNAGYTLLTNVTRGVDSSDGVLTFDTKQENHRAGADVVLIKDPYAASGALTVQLPLNDNSSFNNAGYIYIGSEKATLLGLGSITGTVEIIRLDGTTSSWTGSYSHSDKIRVMEGTVSGGGDYVTPDNPYLNSNIDINGLYSETFTEESAVNKDALDKKCQILLQNRSDIEDVVELEVDNTEEFFTDITLGDAVSISGGDVINQNDSGASPTFRLVEYEFTWPPAKCVVYLNKLNRRINFNTGETFTEIFPWQSNRFSNNNIRGKDFSSFLKAVSSGQKNVYDFYNREVNGVVLNKSYTELTNEDEDKAVNVKTLKEGLNYSSGGGRSLWFKSDSSSLKPIENGLNILPNGGLTSSIGDSSNYWDSVYTSSIYLEDSYNITHDGSYTIFGNSDGWKGGSTGVDVSLLRFYKGNTDSSTFYYLPTVKFEDSIPILYSDIRTNVESYDSFTGMIYYDTTNDVLRLYNGLSWDDVGGSSSLWESSGSGVRPITSDDDILPNGTANIGSSSDKWSAGYFNELNAPTGVFTTYLYSSGGTSVAVINSSIFSFVNAEINIDFSCGKIDSEVELDMNNNNITAVNSITATSITLGGVTKTSWPTGLWEDVEGYRPSTSGKDVVPNGTADLGTSINRWDYGYFNTVNFGSNSYATVSGTDLNIIGDEGVQIGASTSGSGVWVATTISTFRPNNNGSTDLGLSSYYWDNVYGETFITPTDSGTWSIYGGIGNLLIIPSVSGEEVQIGTSLNNADLIVPYGYLRIRGGDKIGKLTLSTSAPSGGSEGDIWFEY